jgi:H+-transporting ATPase
VVHGRNELQEKSKTKLRLFLEQLWAPMPCMIWVAILVEAAIEDWLDFGILLSLQLINASVSFYEAAKAGDAVAALKAALKPSAVAKRDGKWATINAAILVPGDLVMLGAGAAVPADCVVNGGVIDVDQAALTGESLPVTMQTGDRPKMGSTVSRGEVEATVEFTGGKTFFGKTAAMIQGVEQTSNIQKVLIRIMIFLLAISFLLCGICFVYLLAEHADFKDSLAYVVVLLVASIPIAMEVVTTTTMALGSKTLTHGGAIVSRLAAIEELAGMNMLCSDKTGTLTLNKMVIQDHTPCFVDGIDQERLLHFAALATKWHEPPKDALDTLVLNAVDKGPLDAYTQLDYMPFDPKIKRTEATLKDATGFVFKISKGAPDVLLKLLPKDGSADAVCAAVNAAVEELASRGIRSLAVARTLKSDEWQLMGMLTFLDPPRPDTKETLRLAKEFGIDVKMITGDHKAIAKETCRQLGLGDSVLGREGLPDLDEDGKAPGDLSQYVPLILGADGFAQVFPEHKFLIVDALKKAGYAVGMTGDGVNDAPALKKADIGIAVQGATDAARAAADIVLTSPGLSVIIEAIRVSRCIFNRIQNFVIYRVGCTLQLLIFFFIALLFFHPSKYDAANNNGISSYQDSFCLKNPSNPCSKLENCDLVAIAKTAHTYSCWTPYFDMPVIALILITLLNDGTIIAIAYDNVRPSNMPEAWHLPSLYITSSLLGAIACVSSIIMLHIVLDSNNKDGFWHSLNLGSSGDRHGTDNIGLSIQQVKCCVYLKVSLSDFLTLFAARTRSYFFESPGPSGKLMFAALVAMGLSTIFALVWPFGQGLVPLDAVVVCLVWAYVIFWWLIQDTAKWCLYGVWRVIARGRSTLQLGVVRSRWELFLIGLTVAQKPAGEMRQALLGGDEDHV